MLPPAGLGIAGAIKKVPTIQRLIGLCAVELGFWYGGACAPIEVSGTADYQAGDLVTNEIVTPIRLLVTDPQQTAEWRRREAQRVPLIFRVYTNTVEEVEAGFLAEFASVREKFLSDLERNYRRRTLGAQAVTNGRFARFVGAFQKQNSSLPVGSALARLWALGESDETLQAEWGALLRTPLTGWIRPDGLPAAARGGPPQARVLLLGSSNDTPDLALAESLPPSLHRTNIVQLSVARQQLRKQFPPEEQALARYLAARLKPNCYFDEALTRQSRDKRTETLWASATYEPGQVVARAGQVVDEKTKAALEQLRAARTVEVLTAQMAVQKEETRAAVLQLHSELARAHVRTQAAAKRTRWLMGIAAALCLVVVGVVWRLYRVRRRRSLLPARVGRDLSGVTVISCPACSEQFVLPLASGAVATSPPGSGGAWELRALDAERRAERATAMVRTGVVAQLVQWLKQNLLQGLISQRRELLATQEQALREIEQLEGRLEKVQAPLAERLAAYEKRIAELEQQLAARDAQSRELLEAQIALVRKKLADAQAGNPPAWN